MNTDIGTKFEHLSEEEYQELLPYFSEFKDRYIHVNEDLSAEIKAIPVHIETPEEEIERLKRYLTSTDYTVVKCMESGLSMSETYPEIHQKRTEARARINELEALFESESSEDVTSSDK